METDKLVSQKRSRGTLDQVNEAGLLNCQSLANQIIQQKGWVAENMKSSIFEFAGKFTNKAKQTSKMIAKEVFVNEDASTSEGAHDQAELANEIQINQLLQLQDPGHVFFPRFQGVYDTTKFFSETFRNLPQKTQTQQDRKEDVKQYLSREEYGSKYQIYVMFMEQMSFSLYDYLQQIFSREASFALLNTRLRIGEYVSKALSQIASLLTHCDIKPQNVMFKKITM